MAVSQSRRLQVVLERQRRTAEFQERARQAEKAQGELIGLREALPRLVDRQADFASFG